MASIVHTQTVEQRVTVDNSKGEDKDVTFFNIILKGIFEVVPLKLHFLSKMQHICFCLLKQSNTCDF